MSVNSSILGKCGEPVDSSRLISSAAFAVSISYSATYKGVGSRAVTMSGSGSASWTRIPFPRAINATTTQPGSGAFYVAQQCCCKCRAAFIFGDETFLTQPLTCGIALISMTIRKSEQALDEDGNPTGDASHEDVTRTPYIQLWNKLDAPCRRVGGYSFLPPKARLLVPLDPLGVIGDEGITDGITLSVSGSAGAEEDTTGHDEVLGYKSFFFSSPSPCSDSQNLSCVIKKSWTLDDVDASSTITVDFSMG